MCVAGAVTKCYEWMPLLTMRLGFGIVDCIVERYLEAGIDGQQVITSCYQAGHMLLEPQVLALQLMEAVQQRGNCVCVEKSERFSGFARGGCACFSFGD